MEEEGKPSRWLKVWHFSAPFILGVAAIIGCALFAKYVVHPKVSYNNSYKSVMIVSETKNSMLFSPCISTNTSLHMTKDTVILTRPSDVLSGKPVKVADRDEVLVQTASGAAFGLLRVPHPLLPKTQQNELLLVITGVGVVVLSPNSNCDDIHSYLDHLSKR